MGTKLKLTKTKTTGVHWGRRRSNGSMNWFVKDIRVFGSQMVSVRFLFFPPSYSSYHSSSSRTSWLHLYNLLLHYPSCPALIRMFSSAAPAAPPPHPPPLLAPISLCSPWSNFWRFFLSSQAFFPPPLPLPPPPLHPFPLNPYRACLRPESCCPGSVYDLPPNALYFDVWSCDIYFIKLWVFPKHGILLAVLISSLLPLGKHT